MGLEDQEPSCCELTVLTATPQLINLTLVLDQDCRQYYSRGGEVGSVHRWQPGSDYQI